jgi:Zn-dependent protease with chaperone function
MIAGTYFDGKNAAGHSVRLAIEGERLTLGGSGLALDLPLGEVDFGEPLANAPRCIELSGGARCEVADSAAVDRMLAAAGIKESRVVRMQKRWLWALAAFFVVLAGSASAYLWGLPAASRFVARQLPMPLVEKVSRAALQQLDVKPLRPSALPPARQEELRNRAQAFLAGSPVAWRLHFRSAPGLGANAFALPGGEIILLDGLVDKLDDREIEAVLAHEVGHLVHRHSLTLIVENAALALALTAWFGDVSTTAVSTASVLLQTRYSRAAELEADAYAGRWLLRCCGTVEPLVKSLERFERPRSRPENAFATHPDTRQRIAALKAMQL